MIKSVEEKNIKDRWELFSGNDELWHQAIKDLELTSYVHDINWAHHLSDLGWSVCRWQFKKKHSAVAFLQGFLKRYPGGIGILWFPDWIIGDYKFGAEIQKSICEILELNFVYIRFRSNHPFNDNDYIKIIENKWKEPKNLFGTGMTMLLDISGSSEDLVKGLSQNWRRSLKKSSKYNLRVEEVNNPDTVSNIYDEMRQNKGLKSKEVYSLKEIKSIMNAFGDKIIVLGARQENGPIIAIRACLIHGDLATDIFAATSKDALDTFVSYYLLIDLINKSKSRGCSLYDLNGIDPANSKGVYNFKKGTGAVPVKNIGEFEWSNNFILFSALNIIFNIR